MSEMEVDDDLEMKEEDSPEVSPVVSSDEDDADLERIAQLQKDVKASPYTYELHIQLINLCKESGELESLRAARDKMSELFPLTPELWLDWLRQENSLATTPEQKEHLCTLYERALKDYPAVDVWLEYTQFSIGKIGDSWEDAGLANCRQIFEKAVTCVGIHVEQGAFVWETYRTFENIYLIHLKNEVAASETIKKQEERIFNVYKRQLSIPLIGMAETRNEFEGLQFDHFVPDKSSIVYSYSKALKKLELIQPYEDALKTSEYPHLDEYKMYIQFEKKEGEPIRVQSMYERALIDNCLKEDLWVEYAKYASQVIKIREISVPIYERAVRNCPWCVQLWVDYGRALERFGEDHSKITGAFETSLGMGFTKAEDFKELWLAYIGYLRRKIDKEKLESETPNSDFGNILEVYDRAITQMKHYFWGSESEYVIMKSWIVFMARYKKDLEAARKIWKELVDHGHKEEARVWLDFANFEKLYGDAAHYRKILLVALSSVSDWQETFVDLLVTFERDEGTLESLEKTLSRCEVQMQQINDKRLKKLEEVGDLERDDKRRNVSKRQAKQFPRGGGDHFEQKPPVQMDSEGFKIPPPPPNKGHGSPNSKSSESVNEFESERKKRKFSDNERDSEQKKKKKEDSSEIHGESVKHDPSKDDRTVFLSNLSFKIDEDKIKDFFTQIGEVEEVRLVKDYKGRSKGFCYVVYKSPEHAKIALTKDRALLDNRPVLISPCEDKKNNPSFHPKFKFATSLERNKLFIKNLPHSTSKEDLENMFKRFGTLKEVRLVTYRNGHSKGLAYVEFHDETSASNAVVQMDGTQVMESVISVAISNPPPRKPKREFPGVSIADSLGGGGGRPKGPRGRGRTQLTLLPRSVVRPSVGKKKPSAPNGAVTNGQNATSEDTPPTKPLSNSDFARMLQK